MTSTPTSTPAVKVPTREYGYANFNGGAVSMPWRRFVDTREYVPELRFPSSIDTFDQMRNDPKVEAVYLACVQPILGYEWFIDPNGARADVYRPYAEDLGLPVLGEKAAPRLRNRGRFQHDRHMWEAMLAALYGFYPFEIIGGYPNGKDQLWRMLDLGPRPPATITQLEVDDRGRLLAIEQLASLDVPPIPESQVVPFVFRMEGANWYGRSLLRSSYKPWLIKDRVLRIATLAIERNGMGVPIAEMNEGASEEEIEAGHALASAYRAGDLSGAAIVNGKLTLQGVTGSTAPVMEFLQYLDEQVSHGTLTQFMDLGSTQNGSRALGDTLLSFFQTSQAGMAKWYAGTMNDYLTERWVDINFGPDEVAPKLAFKRTEDPAAALAPLLQAIQAGAVTVEPAVENEIRQHLGIAARTSASPAPNARQRPSGEAPVAASAPVQAADPSKDQQPLPGFHRDPYQHELDAGVDVHAIDAAFNAAFADLKASWKDVTSAQIDALHDAMAATGDLVKLASLQAPVEGRQVLADAMRAMAEQARDFAIAELRSQGATIDAPTLDAVESAIEQRAEAVAMRIANRVSGAASRQALLRTGEGTTPTEVATTAREYLSGLKFADVEEALQGALQSGLNAGRHAVFDEHLPSGSRIFANEILDPNTCMACSQVDGTEYASMADAERDYPVGGFVDCAGLDRCRGMLVAILPSEAPASVQDEAGA